MAAFPRKGRSRRPAHKDAARHLAVIKLVD
jgi:hypothetical protein